MAKTGSVNSQRGHLIASGTDGQSIKEQAAGTASQRDAVVTLVASDADFFNAGDASNNAGDGTAIARHSGEVIQGQVLSLSQTQRVGAIATLEAGQRTQLAGAVGIGANDEDIVAAAAIKRVGAASTRKRVVTSTAGDGVSRFATRDLDGRGAVRCIKACDLENIGWREVRICINWRHGDAVRQNTECRHVNGDQRTPGVATEHQLCTAFKDRGVGFIGQGNDGGNAIAGARARIGDCVRDGSGVTRSKAGRRGVGHSPENSLQICCRNAQTGRRQG